MLLPVDFRNLRSAGPAGAFSPAIAVEPLRLHHLPWHRLMTILENRYGKSRVRVARLIRGRDHHDFYEMTVAIQLEGDFESSYTAGDNSQVLPTDTMKNT